MILMDATTLLQTLQRKGLRVALGGDRLLVGPARLLTAEDRANIAAQKEALKALIALRRSSESKALMPAPIRGRERLNEMLGATDPWEPGEYAGSLSALERFSRGLSAIAAAQAQGRDTRVWEQHLALLEAQVEERPGAGPPPQPADPCATCGGTRWRCWREEATGWVWICCRCRPLVIINVDGTRWCAS